VEVLYNVLASGETATTECPDIDHGRSDLSSSGSRSAPIRSAMTRTRCPSTRLGHTMVLSCIVLASLLAGCSTTPSVHRNATPHRRHRSRVTTPVTTVLPPSPGPPGTGGFSVFYGVNFDLAGFVPFAGTDTATLLAALDPSTIRWPGGTEADFYDWHSGLSTLKPAKEPFTLADLAAACRATGAVPIFDLNVLAPGNETNPSDQIAMLKAAKRLGLPIDYVEVGNELYSNAPGAPQAFPDAASYARTVSIYVEALHQAFPGVQVAADAIPFPEDRRESSWDAELLADLQGPSSPDAFIVHFYPGLYQNPFASSDLPTLFENVYGSVSELSQAIQGLGGKPVWLTEYNMRGPYRVFRLKGASPAEHDYAHELYLAAFAAMLPRIPGLALVDDWTALADGFYGAWQDPASPYLTPAGQAVEMVDRAARGATTAEAMPVPGAPTLPSGEPGVVGEHFMTLGSSGSAVLVNLTPDTALLPLGGWLISGTPYEQVTGDPTASESAAANPTPGTLGTAGLTLPPYSVTLVGKAASSS
jgi:hypothetical protein